MVLAGNVSAFPSPAAVMYLTTPLLLSPDEIKGISPSSTSSAFISHFVNWISNISDIENHFQSRVLISNFLFITEVSLKVGSAL